MAQGQGLHQLFNANYKKLPFEGKWAASFGLPEHTGSWFFWADSGNGKTAFAAQLAEYLSHFGRVGYNSIEEGRSLSLKQAFERANITTKHNITPYFKATIPEMTELLAKHKSPKFLITDSVQYTGLTRMQYKKFIDQFPNKLFIWISHADGKRPRGSLAVDIHYDAFIKGYIEGFKVFPKTRYGGGEPFVIWDEGAEEYWLDKE